MNIRRWAVAGLAACAALALATGCSGTKNGDTGQTTVTQSPTPAPKDALAASVRELQKSSFSFMMKDAESEARGSVDPGAKNAQVKATFTGAQSGMSLKMEILILADTETYIKLDFGSVAIPGLPPTDKWLHLDKTKIKNPDSLDLEVAKNADPAGSETVFRSIVDVQSAGDRKYTGTLDLTKATDADIVDKNIVKDLGEAAKSVPFEATLDDKGRLSSLKINVPAGTKTKAQTWEVTYSDYGTAPKVEKPPAAETMEAPQAVSTSSTAEARSTLFQILDSDRRHSGGGRPRSAGRAA